MVRAKNAASVLSLQSNITNNGVCSRQHCFSGVSVTAMSAGTASELSRQRWVSGRLSKGKECWQWARFGEQ